MFLKKKEYFFRRGDGETGCPEPILIFSDGTGRVFGASVRIGILALYLNPKDL